MNCLVCGAASIGFHTDHLDVTPFGAKDSVYLPGNTYWVPCGHIAKRAPKG